MKRISLKSLAYILASFLILSITSCNKQNEPSSLKEVNQLRELFHNKWANRAIHATVDINDIFSTIRHDGKSEYIYSLDKAVRKLNDGHVRLIPPQDMLQNERYSGLVIKPVKEGYALIACNDMNNCKGLKTPILVKEIDGIPIEEWLLKESTNEYASTRHAAIFAALKSVNWHRRLPYYVPPKTITYSDNHKKLIRREVIWSEKEYFARDDKWKNSNHKCISGNILTSDIYYLRISTFSCQLSYKENESDFLKNFTTQLEVALESASPAKGVILDLRGNGGGGDPEGKMIASLFIKQKEFWFKISHLLEDMDWWFRLWRVFDKEWQKPFVSYLSPGTTHNLFNKSRLVVLADSGCFSTCEIVVSSLKDAGIATVIGQTTHGGVGDPKEWKAPFNNFHVAYTTALLWRKNGQLIEGRGIEPSYAFIPSIDEYYKVDDPLKDFAISFLQQ